MPDVLQTQLYTLTLTPGEQVPALPPDWRHPSRCAPPVVTLALLDSDAPGVPIRLRTDRSAAAPARRLEPSGSIDGRTVTLALPATNPHLELDARHTPAAVAAIAAPTTATDGYDVHDLDVVTLHCPGDASGSWRIWAFDGATWTPWQGAAAAVIGAAGLTETVDPLRLIRRLAVELSGLAAPITPRWSFSLAADATVTVTLQAHGGTP